MRIVSSGGPVEQHPAGRHNLAHEVEIADVAGQHRVSSLQRMQVDRGVIQRGDLLAWLETAKPEHEPRQDARLQQHARADGVLKAMPRDLVGRLSNAWRIVAT